MNNKKKFPLGLKFIICFFIVSIPLWIIGQGIAVFSYETAAELGFQVSTEGMDPALIPVSQGIALGDVILQVPLFALAAIGLWRLSFSGAVVSWLALGTNLYWPIIAWTKQYTQVQAGVDKPFGLGTHGLLAFILIVSIWASWYLYKKREIFQ
ncbi:MAG: hypothetical protein GY754_46525 [bacterium]|nr:hypothetical protein [bacterium]